MRVNLKDLAESEATRSLTDRLGSSVAAFQDSSSAAGPDKNPDVFSSTYQAGGGEKHGGIWKANGSLINEVQD